MRKISTSGTILLLDILLIACTSPDNLRLEQALQWYTIPEKIFNQRLLFIKNDSLNTY